MRYIHKNINSEGHKLLEEWNLLRYKTNQELVYRDFNKKKELNDHLREEQGGICCYCQQRITTFKQTSRTGDSHNEHLFPQKGANARIELQTNHGNLFACCCYSVGFPKKLQHCGEAKHESIIYDFIKWVDCDQHFKYNNIGEIIPTGPYNSFKEFKDNRGLLIGKQLKALEAIEILKLNQTTLVEERKKEITALIKMLDKFSYDEIQIKIKEFNVKPYKRFIDMILYYMRKKKRTS
jgi:hypothetical protein